MRRSDALLVMVAAVCLAACGSGAPPASSSASDAGPATIWIAGLRVAADPNDLDADTQAAKDLVGPAIAVGPVACFGGVPAAFDPAHYVLGVVGASQREVEDLVATLGRTPLFVVEATDLCVH
jgi:hypothetical protein